MSCIKFPSSKSELTKSSNKENAKDYDKENSQLITTANQVFGDGNWSHAITNQTLDFVEYITGKYQAGCVSIVRVQLKDGTFHEDMGYICTEGSTKGSAIQKARFGSFNCALKKVLMCFGNEISDRISKPISRSLSPKPLEITPSNHFLAPVVSDVEIVNQIASEAFEEEIPISQTDALMDTVDLEIFNTKDQNSNDIVVNKEVKDSIPKSGIALGASNSLEKDIKPNAPKIVSSAGPSTITKKDDKGNIVNSSKKESIAEVPKLVVTTVMTEEEMRLERKRKQREMQEEFKRKEQIKKKCGDNGIKSTPNPRY